MSFISVHVRGPKTVMQTHSHIEGHPSAMALALWCLWCCGLLSPFMKGSALVLCFLGALEGCHSWIQHNGGAGLKCNATGAQILGSFIVKLGSILE